jgi:hypothetical protein
MQALIRQGRTVIPENFNENCSQRDRRSCAWRHAIIGKKVTYKNRLEIGSDGQSTDNQTAEDHKGQSVINLTLMNRPIKKYSTLADHQATGSDHEVVE